ncbi:coiled-coil domain-containing protein 55-domain containing protein [Mycotypha africana]|uniref:coiled-coil domain-containing protein 55-domain containing protein n=1 Tax=Mycotypha africana TaxID=64632 RepID=UPI002300F0B4|nr:coiled-coil domain-containing protein 55-domain containing protein [Mycotypha africana]KAI8990780.1 coiled-coil domain-containing protein 55-domain containing protein [Mycotypha africana]
MQKMKFGLNLQKKKTLSQSLSKKSAFHSTSDDELERDDEEDQKQQQLHSNKKAKAQVNRQLSSYNTMTKKIAEEQAKALEEDPNIFDYDAVYDDLKEVERKKKEAVKPTSTKPKYIQNLLEMAEIRKRDRLLAQERKVAREREEEGEEFADREVFVTEAFKKQKEDMDMFYKQVLEKKEAEHQALMKALAERSVDKNVSSAGTQKKEILDTDLAKEAAKEGKNVILNDSNEIVDKRQLLTAGLNVKPKFGSLGSLAQSDERIKERMEEYEAYKRKKVEEYNAKRKQGRDSDERERLSKEIEKQMMEVKQKEKEEEERKQKELEQKVLAKRTTHDAAMNARERYLARKKQKLEEQKNLSSSSSV